MSLGRLKIVVFRSRPCPVEGLYCDFLEDFLVFFLAARSYYRYTDTDTNISVSVRRKFKEILIFPKSPIYIPNRYRYIGVIPLPGSYRFWYRYMIQILHQKIGMKLINRYRYPPYPYLLYRTDTDIPHTEPIPIPGLYRYRVSVPGIGIGISAHTGYR